MCRWIAYRGRPVFIEDVVTKPAHSLIHQSQHAEEAKTVINGDGFGVGWYGERPEPGVFRDVRPAWSDENLHAIAHNVRAGLFFAHVRASTGTAISRTNCHPFSHERWLFMHNGQVGGYAGLRRAVEALIPDGLYASRLGTTDTEALFLVALAAGIGRCPVAGMADMLAQVHAMMLEAGVTEPLRFAAALSNGRDVYAFRWSSDARAPTVYWCDCGGDLMIVSEPVDRVEGRWQALPPGHALVGRAGEPLAVTPFAPARIGMRTAA